MNRRSEGGRTCKGMTLIEKLVPSKILHDFSAKKRKVEEWVRRCCTRGITFSFNIRIDNRMIGKSPKEGRAK